MDLVQEMISHAGLLYKIAYEKVNNSLDAEDLVQETFLCTLKIIKSGTHIENIKAYLLKVLNSKYCDYVRAKNNNLLLNYNETHFVTSEDYAEQDTTDEELLKSNEAIAIRKELAYLSKIYREIMVQFYMQGKSVNEIKTVA